MSENVSMPLELRAPRGARVLEIDWADGATARYPHGVLRGFCPCAHCQGHQGPIRWAGDYEDGALEITSIEEIGSYALKFVWGDGHNTGLYTFAFLRELAKISELPVDDVRDSRFAR